MLRFSLLRMMDWLSFDKVQVKGEVLKAVRKLLVRKLSWSLGLTDMQGNVLRNGRSETTKPLVVQTCVNIVSVGTLCVKTRRSLKRFTKECRTPEKCNLWVPHANINLRQMWGLDRVLTLYVLFFFSPTYYCISFLFQVSHTYSHHTQSFAALRKIPTE